MELHTLTQAACSYVLLIWVNFTVKKDGVIQLSMSVVMEHLSFLFHYRWCLTRVSSWHNIAMTIQWSPSSRQPSHLRTPQRGGSVISQRYGDLSCHYTYSMQPSIWSSQRRKQYFGMFICKSHIFQRNLLTVWLTNVYTKTF